MVIIPLVENRKVSNSRLKNEKGLSLYIESGKKKIIFDLGGSNIFKINAENMDIKLKDIDCFIISHGHSDHIGGYSFLGDDEKKRTISHMLVKSKFTFSLLGNHFDIGDNSHIKIAGMNKKFLEIVPNIFLLNTSRRKPSFFYRINGKKDYFNHEYHLIIIENDKINIVTGCCHCGLIALIDEVKLKFPNKQINSLTGGIHTRNFIKNFTQIIKIIFILKKENIKSINLGHCTGIVTTKIFKFFIDVNKLEIAKKIEIDGF